LAVIDGSVRVLAVEGAGGAGPVPAVQVGPQGRQGRPRYGIERVLEIKSRGISDIHGGDPSSDAAAIVARVPPGDGPAIVWRRRPAGGRLVPDLHSPAAAGDIRGGAVAQPDREAPSGPVVTTGAVIGLDRDHIGPDHQVRRGDRDANDRVTVRDTRNGCAPIFRMAVDPDISEVIRSHADMGGRNRTLGPEVGSNPGE